MYSIGAGSTANPNVITKPIVAKGNTDDPLRSAGEVASREYEQQPGDGQPRNHAEEAH